MKDASVAIHGHFYQPPRENPWLEAIEHEESASPFHDWNERIAFECYRPNAYARIVDSRGKILDLINNYSFLSFNFGPTLLSWIEKKRPLIYQKILEADRESFRRLGNGNAIAQVYDHLIMPLAHSRDQETEVRWGIADFERHFRRKPEAMWLPETAVNYVTLQILIEHGMSYLILSPFQALRVRSFASKKWMDVSQGKIDTTQPYRCFLRDRSGKKLLDQYIDIFFYDGVISREIAFGELLQDGNRFCQRFVQAFRKEKKGPQLIHVSTDGETYGHHKKFGEMALAYALSKGLTAQGFKVLNYGAFLKRFPPVYEVEIDEGPRGEGSAWSCSHGVGRWKEDCGCSTGGQPGWNQRWRGPLREALNLLRDDLGILFEKEGENIFRDPWEARKGYIDVIMDRSPESIQKFFERFGRQGLEEKGRIKGLKLLEMQRHALRMFTSCGWFFSDLAGLETQLILQHAARAIQLSEEFSNQEIERRFLQVLSQGQSNLPEMRDGLQIYEQLVKPKQVSLEQVVNHYAFSSLLDADEKEKRIFCFRAKGIENERIEKDGRSLLLGKVRVISDIIPESKEFFFGLIFSKGRLPQNWISEDRGTLDFNTLKQKGVDAFEKGREELKEVLAFLLGNQIYTIRDILKEERAEIFRKFVQEEIGETFRIYAEIFNRTKPTIEILTGERMEIPYEICAAAEITLSHRLLQEVRQLREDLGSPLAKGAIEQIVEESKRYGCRLRKEESLVVLNELLKEKMECLRRTKCSDLPAQEGLIQEIIILLDLSKKWDFALDLWEAQDLMHEILDESIKNLEESLWGYGVLKPFPSNLITLAERLNFNTEKLSTAAGLKKRQ
jgi:alpha-amylase/alpha-mannosidase (GH57 family)